MKHLDPALIVPVKYRLWYDGDLSWKLWPQQEPIYYGIRRLTAAVVEVVVLCARQFGKSHLGVLLAIEDCLKFQDSCILLMGPTLKQAMSIVTPRLKAIAKDAPPGLIKPSKSEAKWYIGSSELVVGGFDINSTSQRGKTVQRIYIEEVVDSNPDDYQESMRSDLGPALTHSKEGRMIFLSTLPKVPDHPFITDTMAKAEMNGVLFSYTIEDNKQLSPEQKARCIELAGGVNSIDYRREYLNEIIRDPGLVVVPDFDRDVHVRSVMEPQSANGQVTVDWGGTRDFTVALLHWYDYQIDKMIVWDEVWFPNNTPTDKIMPAILEMIARRPEGVNMTDAEGRSKLVADVPGQLAVDLMSAGYTITAPPKDDWQASINNTALQFTQNRIQIDPRCKLLATTLNSGTFNKQRNDFERSGALGHCDAIACLMYAVRTQDRANPFKPVVRGLDHMHWKTKKTEEDRLAEAIAGATFSFDTGVGTKRFGKFK